MNYQTSYAYDALDDLTGVTQIQASPAVTQTRTFVYDGLKRLTDATNPESGHVHYTYDENGNLSTKTDARSITTTCSYDTLNRVKMKSYQGDTSGTLAVSYFYDAQTLPALPTGAPAFTRGSSTGRLVAVIYGGGNTGSYQGYDQMGRVVQSIQVTETQATGSPNPQAYGFGYSYNLASEMLTETYPSGRIVQTEYDAAGRVAGVKNEGATTYYAGATASDTTNRIQYASHGAVSAMKLGNGKWEHMTYDPKRLQPTLIGLGTSSIDSSTLQLDYTYSNSNPNVHDNNGNVQTQKITVAGSPNLVLTQSYSYDALNRLTGASENSGASWSQTYGYDRFGNRWVSASSGYMVSTLTPQAQNAFNGSNNRLVASGYDGAGNQTGDIQNRTFTYDAENRQITFNGTLGQYFYDGDGRRVKKIDSSGTTVFVYNVGGQLIAEYTSGPPSGSGTSYLTSDHLGSTRVVMKPDGTVARHDFLPFGEEISSTIGGRGSVPGYGGADTTRQKFTQKERDTESGLDYFGARYYSSAQGRFLSADPVRGSTRTPQTWNLYVYVLNNPLRFIDPTGMWHYEEREIDGKKYQIAVGDYDNEYVKGVGYWNSKSGEWGKYHDWTPGLSSSSRLIFTELDRRRNASMWAIGAFSGGTAVAGGIAGGGAYLGGVAFGAGMTTLGLSGGGGTVVGLYGTTTVATLESLAASGGSTEVVVTSLTQAPAAGQGLSVATGQGGEALASAARAGGQLFRAEIPKALIREMERVGLAFRSTTSMGGAAAGEIRFIPEATRFIVKFFK